MIQLSQACQEHRDLWGSELHVTRLEIQVFLFQKPTDLMGPTQDENNQAQHWALPKFSTATHSPLKTRGTTTQALHGGYGRGPGSMRHECFMLEQLQASDCSQGLSGW